MSVYHVKENKVPDSEPALANVEGTDLATNEEARPVPIFAGYAKVGLQWLSKLYDITREPVEKKVGKDKTKVGENVFGHIFGGASIGGVTHFRELEVNNEIWWRGTIKATGPSHSFTIPGKCTVTIRWGTPGQSGPTALDTSALNSDLRYYVNPQTGRPYSNPDTIPSDIELGIDHATPGSVHPSYEHDFTVELTDFYLGFNAGAVPSVKVGIERLPQIWTEEPDNVLTYEGANPVYHIAELLQNPVWGIPGLEHIDETTWKAFASAVRRSAAVEITGVGSHTASLGHQSPLLTREKKLATYINEIFANLDAFLYWQGDKLVPGLETYEAPELLPVLDVRGMVEPPRTKKQYGSDTRVTVEIRDRGSNLKKAAVSDSRLAASQREGKPAKAKVSALNFITRHQGKALAAREAAIRSSDRLTGSVPVLASWLLSQGLGLGKAFRIVYSPTGLDHAVRITELDWSPDGRVVSVSFTQLHGVSIDSLEPHVVAKPDLSPIPPTPAPHSRIFQLPRAYGRAVYALASREHENQVGFSLWYSEDDASYDYLGEQDAFALHATFATDASPGVASIQINATGPDLYKLESQSATAQADDSLLAIAGDSIYSIGSVTADGGDLYTLSILGNRLQTQSGSHFAGDSLYIIRRAELETFRHAAFPYESETRYFKFQPNTFEAALDLGDAPARSFLFAARGLDSPANLTISGIPSGFALSFTHPNEPSEISSVRLYLAATSSQPSNPVATYGGNTTAIAYQSADYATATTRHAWVELVASDGRTGLAYLGSATSVEPGTGPAGTSIVMKGEFASAAALEAALGAPQNGWAYRNTVDKKTYVYQGDTWYEVARDGVSGAGMFALHQMSWPPEAPSGIYKGADNVVIDSPNSFYKALSGTTASDAIVASNVSYTGNLFASARIRSGSSLSTGIWLFPRNDQVPYPLGEEENVILFYAQDSGGKLLRYRYPDPDGVKITDTIPTEWTIGGELRIEYTNGRVRLFYDGALVHEGITKPDMRLYFAGAATVQNEGLTDITFGPMGRDGQDGAPAIHALLTNEAHSIATDAAGENGYYATASTAFIIFEGSSDVTDLWTLAKTDSNCVSTLTGRTVQVSSLTADSGYVEITATRDGYPAIVKRFTLQKTRKGADGTSPPLVKLSASSQIFTYPKGGGVTPAAITFTATGQHVTGSPVFSVPSGSATLTGSGNTRTLAAADLATDTATIRVTWSGQVDEITVAKLYDGTDGQNGATFLSGTTVPTSGLGATGDHYLNTATGDVYKKTASTTWTLQGNINGDPGADGDKWHSGTTAPSSSLGTQGDFYINTTTNDVYQKTGSATWTLQTNIKGTPGTNGATFLSGSGVPSSGLGSTGDHYLNTASGDVYKKTGSTTWTIQGNIIGDPGADGDKWHSGTTAPSSSLGTVGDFYINTTTNDVYQKTGSTTWTLQTNIKGTPGTPGTNGATFLSGTGLPTSGLGTVGDHYLNLATGDVYKKTASTTWTIQGNIKGSDGDKWHSGTGAPSSSLGSVGHFYLDNATGDVYQKNGSTTWTLQSNLKGADGQTPEQYATDGSFNSGTNNNSWTTIASLTLPAGTWHCTFTGHYAGGGGGSPGFTAGNFIQEILAKGAVIKTYQVVGTGFGQSYAYGATVEAVSNATIAVRGKMETGSGFTGSWGGETSILANEITS